MRVSSLSNEQNIDLLTRYFVPVWVSRDRYQLGEASREEKLLLGKVDVSRRGQKLEGGAVCVYLATADGAVSATLPVQKASKPELLTAFLKRAVADGKLAPRRDEDIKAARAPAAPPARAKGDGRAFTCRVRFDGPGPNRGVGRDVIALSKDECAALVPKRLEAGARHEVPRATAEKLLRHAYPPLPHWSDKQVKLTAASLSARVVAVKEGEATLRLEGKVELIYPHLGKPTDGAVKAPLLGVAKVKGGALTALTLVADGGEHVWHWQGKAQRRAVGVAIEME